MVYVHVTVNPLLSPPGAYYFQALLSEGLNREGSLKERRGVFILTKHITSSFLKINGDRLGPQNEGSILTQQLSLVNKKRICYEANAYIFSVCQKN